MKKSLLITALFSIAASNGMSDQKYPDIKELEVKYQPKVVDNKNKPDDGRPTIKISVVPSDSDKATAVFYSEDIQFQRRISKMIHSFELGLSNGSIHKNGLTEEISANIVLMNELYKKLANQHKELESTQFSLSDRAQTMFIMLKEIVKDPVNK